MRVPRDPSLPEGNASVDDSRNDRAGDNNLRLPRDPPEVSAANETDQDYPNKEEDSLHSIGKNETDQDSRNKEEESLHSIRKTIHQYFSNKGGHEPASGGPLWDPSVNSAYGGVCYSTSQEDGKAASLLSVLSHLTVPL